MNRGHTRTTFSGWLGQWCRRSRAGLSAPGLVILTYIAHTTLEPLALLMHYGEASRQRDAQGSVVQWPSCCQELHVCFNVFKMYRSLLCITSGQAPLIFHYTKLKITGNMGRNRNLATFEFTKFTKLRACMYSSGSQSGFRATLGLPGGWANAKTNFPFFHCTFNQIYQKQGNFNIRYIFVLRFQTYQNWINIVIGILKTKRAGVMPQLRLVT